MNKILPLLLMLMMAGATALAQDAVGGQQSSAQQQGSRGQRGEGRPGGLRGTAGTITAISGDTITIKQAMNDNVVTVKLSDKTQYRKERDTAKLSDFKVGDFIVVRGERSSENEVAAEVVSAAPPGGRFGMGGGQGGGPMNANMADLGKTFIVGEVKAIDGAKITVHRPDNQDQTIQADENTSFRKGRDSITLPDIKVGDTIMGRGEAKDGVFTPVTLNVMDPAMRQMRRRQGDQPPPPQPPL